MCLSTAYMNAENGQKEVMKDVAHIEAEGQGFWLVNLFGERKFVQGAIKTVNLSDGHFVIFEKPERGELLQV